jgi:hypothetical protein
MAVAEVRKLHTPILPTPPYSKEDTPYWAQRITEAITAAFDEYASRVEDLNTTDGGGGVDDRPEATNERKFWFDSTTGDLYFDNGSWNKVNDVPESLSAIGYPTGVDDEFRENTSFDFEDSTRTFTLRSTAGVTYWISGKKYELTSGADPTLVLPEDEGDYYVYLKTDGTLDYSTTWTREELLQENCYLCAIYLASGFTNIPDGLGGLGSSGLLSSLSEFSLLYGTEQARYDASGEQITFDTSPTWTTNQHEWDAAGTVSDIQSYEMRVGAADWITGNGRIGLMFCIQDVNNWYLARLNGATTGSDLMEIFEKVSGSFVQQASTNPSLHSHSDYDLKISWNSATYTVIFKVKPADEEWDGTNTETLSHTFVGEDFQSGGVGINFNHGSVATGDITELSISATSPTGSGASAIYIGNERHDLMEPRSHELHHLRFGAFLRSGFGLTDITDDGSGDDNSHATIGVEAGVLRDEDIEHESAAIASPAQIPVFYLTGSEPLLRRAAVTNAPCVKGSDRLYFNELSGGTWGLSEVGSNGDYTHSWILATNDNDQPVIALMGQAEYGNARLARLGAADEVASIVSLLPMEEFHFIGGILYQTSTGYSNTWAARIRPDDDGNPYYDLRFARLGSGSPPTSHAGLSDRNLPGQHEDYAIDLSGTHTGLLSAGSDLADLADVVDDLDDGDIPFSGAHTGTLLGQTSVGGAMSVLDDLVTRGLNDVSSSIPSGGDVLQFDFVAGEYQPTAVDDLGLTPPEDDDVDLSGTHDGLLTAASTVADAMEVLDDIPEDGLGFDNDVSVTADDSGGSAKQVFKVTTADILRLGDPTVDMELYAANDVWISGPPLGGSGANLILSNDFGYYGRDTSARDREILVLDGSDDVNVGHTGHELKLLSSGNIDAADNDIETTGDVTAGNSYADKFAGDEVDTPRLQATQEKTLSDGANTEFARVYNTATAPRSQSVMFYYEVEAEDGTDMQVECGTVTFTMVRTSGGTNTAGTAGISGTSNACSSGTLSVAFSAGTAGSDHIRCRVNANSSLTDPRITGRFIAIGNDNRSITWS